MEGNEQETLEYIIPEWKRCLNKLNFWSQSHLNYDLTVDNGYLAECEIIEKRILELEELVIRGSYE
jgi:hypothetical protein